MLPTFPTRTRSYSSFIGFLLFAVFLAGAGSPVQAQDIRIGLQAGGNFASFRGDTGTLTDTGPFPESSIDLGRRSTFHVGGIVQFGISDWFALQPEVNYERKGAVQDATVRAENPQTGDVETIAEIEQVTRFSYLEIPVLAKLRIPTGGPLVPSLFVGPSVGFNLRAEAEAEIRSNIDEIEDETETEEIDTPGTEVGVILGGELGYDLGAGNVVFLTVRYNAGLTNIVDEDDRGDEDVSLQHEVVSVGVGYTFGL